MEDIHTTNAVQAADIGSQNVSSKARSHERRCLISSLSLTVDQGARVPLTVNTLRSVFVTSTIRKPLSTILPIRWYDQE